MGTPLEGALNTPNHKVGHSDKNSIWILVWVGPVPVTGHKNLELRPFDAPAWLPHWSCSESSRNFTPSGVCHCHCSCLVWGWHPTLDPQPNQWPKLCAGGLLCCFYKLPLPACNRCVTFWLIAEVSTSKPGVMERLEHVWGDTFQWCSLAHDSLWWCHWSCTASSGPTHSCEEKNGAERGAVTCSGMSPVTRAGRGKEQVSPRSFRGSAAMLTTDNLILDFRPPELWDACNKFLLF